MMKFINYYIDLINKYFLVRVITILLVIMLISQVVTWINKAVNYQKINENPISKYNTYNPEAMTTKSIAERYFNEYTSLLQYDAELAYDLLEERHKDKYEDIDDFKNYIQEIDFEDIEISNFSVDEDNEYKIYIVNDNLNNVYNFIIKNANEYSVIFECE